jgi:hypothetical protein
MKTLFANLFRRRHGDGAKLHEMADKANTREQERKEQAVVQVDNDCQQAIESADQTLENMLAAQNNELTRSAQQGKYSARIHLYEPKFANLYKWKACVERFPNSSRVLAQRGLSTSVQPVFNVDEEDVEDISDSPEFNGMVELTITW